ncbi:hypothetical protein F5884DRAFT_10208 [Xylogone sp. PMI_703]|nr:hypothetical protein F5884DRAFT_10208 [Xylogone sp. PMI_703]
MLPAPQPGHASSSGTRRRGFRTPTACTVCRQIKVKCDRREKLPGRCTRCETTNSVCEISSTFKRRRVKGPDSDEMVKLRAELEQMRAQVSSLLPQTSPTSTSESIPSSATADKEPTVSEGDERAGTGVQDTTPTLGRTAGDITVLPWQIDAAFEVFFHNIHPLLPFVTQSTPNTCYAREPFLFWTICVLGLRSVTPGLAQALCPFVHAEALHAPHRSCYNQIAATAVVQALLLLSMWPFKSPSLMHESVWLHCGSATHLAMHIGLHQPHSASEFVPKYRRDFQPVSEFRRTWIACYVVNSLVSFSRGYPSTIRADFNLIKYSQSTPTQLGIAPELHKFLLLSRRIEEGVELGSPQSVPHGQIDPATRSGVYGLLQARIAETEEQLKTPSLSTLMNVFLISLKLTPIVQALQSTSPLSLQETAVIQGFELASQLICQAEILQKELNRLYFPVFVDGMVLISAVLILKIQISRFAGLVDQQRGQELVNKACKYYREGVNEFSTIPARLTQFMDGVRTMIAENRLPVGGFVIEKAKCHYTQNILYEVLWDFYEWKRMAVGAAEFQEAPPPPNDTGLNNMVSFLDLEQLDADFWQMLNYTNGPIN